MSVRLCAILRQEIKSTIQVNVRFFFIINCFRRFDKNERKVKANIPRSTKNILTRKKYALT